MVLAKREERNHAEYPATFCAGRDAAAEAEQEEPEAGETSAEMPAETPAETPVEQDGPEAKENTPPALSEKA